MTPTRTLLSLIAGLAPFTSVFAQETEDFARLARRSMTTYEDSIHRQRNGAAWHGGVHLGNSSQGRVLPGTFFTYNQGRWKLKGEVTLDAADTSRSRDEVSTADNGTQKTTDTDTRNRYEHEDMKFRADYNARGQRDVLSFDVFQKLHHDNTFDNSIQGSTDDKGEPLEAKYEEQHRKVRDFNFGVLVEHTHKFAPGGSLASRIYFKYDNKPTDVASETWGKSTAQQAASEHQSYTSADPKAQVVYLSPVWHGFSFGLREKVGMMNMCIDDTASHPASSAGTDASGLSQSFHYDVRESLTSAGADYKAGGLSLSAGVGYEVFHHDIVDHVDADIAHTYYDWLYNASAKYTFAHRNTLSASYAHTINRPSYTQLYPFVHIGSSIAAWVVGNPALQPSVTEQWQAKYTYKIRPLTLNAIVTYKMTEDDITRISTYNAQADRWVKTWVNDATYSTLRMALEGELRLGRLSMTMGAHAQWLHYDGENITADEAWSYSFKVRPQVTLPHDWMLACVVLYNGREVHLHEYNRGYTYTALRLYKQLGQWGLYAFGQDLLRSDHTKVLQNKDATIVSTTDYNARALILGVSYTF